MTQSEQLRRGEWLVLLDGANLLAFENEGVADRPALTLRLQRRADHQPTHALGTDRPGRVHESVGDRRSGVETADLHDEAEAAFIRDGVAALAEAVRAADVSAVIVAAPPRAIAVFRSAVGDDLRNRVRHEVVADLVKHPVADLERRFAEPAAH